MTAPNTPANAPKLQEESLVWQQSYSDPQLVARRTRKHRGKLVKLGVMNWPRDTKLLDLCCGTGEVLRILHSAGFTALHGLDVTPPKELQNETWASVVAGDGHALPYPDGNFEAVICMHSLHHLGGVEGVRKSLNEAKRVLKPGGRLALIDHPDSIQLRIALWCLKQSWLTWPTSGLRSFHQQMIEEWEYLTDYLDHWKDVRAIIDGLNFTPVEMDSNKLFFFYWVGCKPK